MEGSFERRIEDIRARIADLRKRLETKEGVEQPVLFARSDTAQHVHQVAGQGQDLEKARKEKELDDIRKKLMKRG